MVTSKKNILRKTKISLIAEKKAQGIFSIFLFYQNYENLSFIESKSVFYSFETVIPVNK